MRQERELGRTPLHALHVAAGARMVEFAGWHMPVQYSGVIDEHNAVRRQGGLFDVSHMGEAAVRGHGALAFLQHVTCNDVSRIAVGRAQYTALTTPSGCFVDDLLVYRLGQEEFWLVLNAGNTPKDLAWLSAHATGFDVEVQDESAAWAQIALQGPQALATLGPLTEARLEALQYYAFTRDSVAGAPALISRTGYTGEDGFEIYLRPESASHVWQALLASGAGRGVVPVGLAARDTLRLEARMALYGNDIDETTTVFEADLGWIVKLGKGDFIGRDALVRQAEDGIERKLVGFQMAGRAIARAGHVACRDGAPVGRVTSGTHAPYLKRSIGLCYLPIELSAIDTRFEIDLRGRAEEAVVVPTPFYKRPR